MHFDWYRATIDHSPRYVIDAIQSCYELSDVLPGRPFYGYEKAYDVIRGESRLATIMWGGNTGTRTLAEASGQHAEVFTGNVRELFTGVRVCVCACTGALRLPATSGRPVGCGCFALLSTRTRPPVQTRPDIGALPFSDQPSHEQPERLDVAAE